MALFGTTMLYLQLLAAFAITFGFGMKVSFFGDGYITMPLQEAKVSTNIRVKFRTQQENAFIFLAAGRTDHCLMRLENGTITFIYKIDKNIVQLRSLETEKLNNLIWHDVAVQRYENNITLQVNGKVIRKTLPPDMYILNIHFGTFLGGVGDFPADYLNDATGFRGCISDVFYNNINIVKRAKEHTGHTTSRGVSWSCSNEFDGTNEDSISFLNNDSFALMSKESFAKSEILVFEFRTIEESGTLFFNGGYDFVLLEIEDKNLKLTFNKGGSLLQLMTNETINDGKWHNVVLQCNAFSVQLILDDIVYDGFYASDTKATINLEKSIFFGGVQENMRRRLLNKGLLINDISFKGCMRGFQVNNEILGFPQIKISQHLGVKCVWKYPCKEHNPCINSGICNQYGIDQFICYCDQSYCIKADYQGPFKIFTETIPHIELLYVSPMQLLEGGSTILSSHVIELLLDKQKYASIIDSSVVFHVIHQPRYGQLLHFSAEKNTFVQCRSFNLLDLSTDKVKYIHNGMENFSDHATVDLQIYGDANQIPANIFGKHRFLLHANITPVNDPPQLQIPNNKILRVVEGIEKILVEDLFNIQDPDSSADDLIYTIKTNINDDAGRFYINGISSFTFSQVDVNMRKVTFLYNQTVVEQLNYQILLQVSDGIETSDLVNLHVSVYPLELQLINNTGLIIIHKSSTIITSLNLSVGSNVVDENIDIRYNIIKPPQYGVIQKFRQIDASWVNIEHFTDSQLMIGHIRYVHSKDFPWQDEFKFVASYAFAKTQTFDFRITFTRLRINLKTPAFININGSKEFIFSNEMLLYETIPINTFSRNIIYKIIQPPKYGVIFVEGSRKFAKEMDSFTQLDIEKKRIGYKTHLKTYSTFIDYLEFVVSVAECDDVMGKLKIIFTPVPKETDDLIYQNPQILHVQEGESSLVTKEHFEIEFNSYDNLVFTVSIAPEHGALCRYDDKEEKTLPLTEFTLKEMFLNEVYYCHDDTESPTDYFEILILSSNELDFQFVTHVDVEIKLLNDNPPYRSKERIFHVVRNGIRTVSPDILEFLDEDVDTNLSDILFTHVSCTNGIFYKSGNYIDSFSQDDIGNRRILFQHNGPDIGTASFIVTDRKNEINGVLEIHASDSFVSMATTNATIVQESKFVILKNKDFIVETNLDVKYDEILYEVTNAPTYGILMYLGRHSERNISATNFQKSANLTSLNNFTHLDIERDRLVYWNTEIASMDRLRYRVHIKNISAEGEVIFRIYPSAYWEPLQVKRNQTLYVEESTSVLISRDTLEVVHPNISPGDITFLVTSSPLHGYLEMQSMTFDDEYNCKIFDQSAINNEKVFYIQAGVNQSTDYFVFDVTNGITWLKNLILKISIIPEKLYMHANVISVVEGKSVQLNANDIQPNSSYYRGKILEYIILIAPSSGYIMATNSRVKRFTQKQLEQGSIQYMHNGNENASDSITLIASARNKDSMPFKIEFSIIPVNDEQPIVVTNTGLQVWNGGQHVIKNTDLMVQDYDTPAEDLIFYVNYIYGGYLAQQADVRHKIDEFSQKQIDNGEILFMHDQNSARSEISFLVSDGVFNSSLQILNIFIKPVEILLERNEVLHVFPITKKQISNEQLFYKCSDEKRDVYYNITVPPMLGRIINENSENRELIDIMEFTQSDLRNGRIFYEHTATMLEFRTHDYFYFNVGASGSERVLEEKFDIEISVSSGGLLRFVPVVKIIVDEGGTMPVRLDFTKMLDYLRNKAGINNPEVYVISKTPEHGEISYAQVFQGERKFTPNDFHAQKVHYVHDHSDTLEDNILMSVYLVQGNIFLCNLTIPVLINAINDQPFKLITHMPQMSLVEGENITITRNILLTEDKDTTPDEIVYDVTSGPTLGILKKISSDGREDDLLIYSNQFTQDDIDHNRIVYTHFGSPQPTTFCFTVSDGKFEPAYEIFNINIIPVSLATIAEQNPVSLQQGATTAVIKLNHIALKTNAKPTRLSYNITNSPLNGIIVFKHQPTLRFSYEQILTGQIYYMQTDQNRSNDSFQVTAYIAGTHYHISVDVTVVIEPVIKILDVYYTHKPERMRLSSALVNNNPLSLKLNKFNPKFIITSMPASGEIRKIIRNSGMQADSTNERATNTFSFKELRSGVVYFVPNDHLKTSLSNLDSFNYLLIIKTYQPAQGTVLINYEAYINASNENNVAKIDFFKNYKTTCVLIFLIICLILILIFIKFDAIRCHKKCFNKNQPPPLPCPPDLTSVSPQLHHLNYSHSDIGSIPVTASSTPLPGFSNIPHCKIIAMNSYPNDVLDDYDSDSPTDEQCNAQQPMMHQYSPFNMDNDVWSSSCEIGNEFAGYSSIPQKSSSPVPTPSNNVSNPLLRRNQYWV